MLGLAAAACLAAGTVRAATLTVTTVADSVNAARIEFVEPAGSRCAIRGPARPPQIFFAGFEEDDCQALTGLACDGGDSDFCFEGALACVAGAPMCSDNTGSTTELCNGLDDDCDGAVDEDFMPDDNPACAAGTTFIGNLSGDTGSGTLMAQGMSEEFLRFRLTEDNGNLQPVDLAARITLDMPPGIDYDLFVYCTGCGGLLAGMSAQTGFGVQERVTVTADDGAGVDNAINVIIEVRHRAHSVCASWSLTVIGNVAPVLPTCP